MTKREAGYLLIGLGAGLVFSVAAIVYFVAWFQHMFTIGIQWRPAFLLLAIPFVSILIGAILLHRGRGQD